MEFLSAPFTPSMTRTGPLLRVTRPRSPNLVISELSAISTIHPAAVCFEIKSFSDQSRPTPSASATRLM